MLCEGADLKFQVHHTGKLGVIYHDEMNIMKLLQCGNNKQQSLQK